MFCWFRELFRISPRDYTSDFPQQLQTTVAGTLDLKVSTLRADGKLIGVFCRYEPSVAEKPAITFHPDPEKRPDPKKWVSVFDQRATAMRQRWRDCLLAQAELLEQEMDGWVPEELGAEALIQSLELRRILVSDDGSVAMCFAASEHLKDHDLSVDLDSADKITEVAVEG